MKGRSWPLPLWLFLGSLLLQAAWIAAVPPFRGIDEFEHAFRAASVAEGHWMPGPVVTKDGRGNLVTTPRALVDAATAECESYKYTKRKNCNPIRDLGDGNVTVASAAGTYNPVFYWIIGVCSSPFNGALSLYVMRVCAAVLCSGFLAGAGWLTALWARTRWPLVGLVSAMTPITIYTTAMPAPNGIEMMAGLTLWAAMLGLVRPVVSRAVERRLILGAVPAVVVLAGVRLLGPLWLGMIALAVACLMGWVRVRALWHEQKPAVAVLISCAAASTIAGSWWSIISGTITPVDARLSHHFTHPIRNSIIQIPLWIIQNIAAFPTRNEPAPMPVYAVGALLFAAVLVLGCWKSTNRIRLTLIAVALSSLLVPLAMTIATFHSVGAEWQGRYELPFSLGIPLIAALALETRRATHRLFGPLLACGWAALVVAHSLSVGHVLVMEREGSPLAGTSEWHIPPVWLVTALTVAGLALWGLAARQARESHEPRMPEPGPQDAAMDSVDRPMSPSPA